FRSRAGGGPADPGDAGADFAERFVRHGVHQGVRGAGRPLSGTGAAKRAGGPAACAAAGAGPGSAAAWSGPGSAAAWSGPRSAAEVLGKRTGVGRFETC